MSLSKISLRPLRNTVLVFGLRSSSAARNLPPTAAKQLSSPAEVGFFSYTRNWSRDKKYDLSQAPQKGDTPKDFLLRRLGHAYEVYPLIFLTSLWVVLFTFACYWSFDKVEIWLDRSKDDAPWAWERIRDKYWKMNTIVFDLDGRTHKRLEIMEVLQDEMLEAAKKRGTRQ
ncbi:hypothetical protein PMAYCL1PPCAC_31181 [Pristionchus mayeri]|uniref:Uncharacterized protein n=1 Tax=Pristionchus mayeri TaxID=1317129 RepID=A0AAN5DDF2_9BILA|nr:hypothetical protein PMAYCL1PPCAC_31181 [Pristionchus mayeri]